MVDYMLVDSGLRTEPGRRAADPSFQVPAGGTHCGLWLRPRHLV